MLNLHHLTSQHAGVLLSKRVEIRNQLIFHQRQLVRRSTVRLSFIIDFYNTAVASNTFFVVKIAFVLVHETLEEKEFVVHEQFNVESIATYLQLKCSNYIHSFPLPIIGSGRRHS